LAVLLVDQGARRKDRSLGPLGSVACSLRSASATAEQGARARADDLAVRALADVAGGALVQQAVRTDDLARQPPQRGLEVRSRLRALLLGDARHDVADRRPPTLERPRDETPGELRVSLLVLGDLQEGRTHLGLVGSVGPRSHDGGRNRLREAPLAHGRLGDGREVTGELEPADIERARSELLAGGPGRADVAARVNETLARIASDLADLVDLAGTSSDRRKTQASCAALRGEARAVLSARRRGRVCGALGPSRA